MKSLNLYRPAIKAIAMLMVVGSMIFMASCKDDPATPPAPTLTVNPSSTQDVAGAKVTTQVIVDSPAGGQTLTTLVNGATTNAPAAVTLDGTESQTVSVDFTIPTSAQVGNVYTITFQATDNAGQLSQVAFFNVTVAAVPAKQQVQVTADITTDTHWTADKIYVLTKLINVGTDTKDVPNTKMVPTIKATATLTIDAGTVILGAKGTPGGGLIVHRGSKLIANGTADAPIVFTSAQPAGGRVAGDWAGLVICGKATNNVKNSGSTGVDGIEELEGAYGGYHGNGANSDDTDNSGSYKYVRVEFAGYPINPNQEINGITFGSVGSGTTFDYVQVSYSNDDSFEWFGGAVKATHLIAYKGVDDDFDTDNGFHGLVQYGVGIRDANTADQSGSNGFESDNDAAGSLNTPFTDATFANMTIIGGKQFQNTSVSIQFQNIAQIRRNSKIDIVNSFFTAYPNGIYIDDNATSGVGSGAAATAGELVLRNDVLAGVEGWGKDATGAGGNGFGSALNADEQAVFTSRAVGVNHPVSPRGYMVSAGTGGFSSQVFGITVATQIKSESALKWFLDPAVGYNNKTYFAWNDAAIGLDGSIFNPNAGTPNFLPAAGKLLAAPGTLSGSVITGLDNTNYIGAFSNADWTAKWSNWAPQTTDYTK